MHQADELIGTAEAATILGYSRKHTNHLAKIGALPIAQKLPGRTGAILFRRSAVEALAAERAA